MTVIQELPPSTEERLLRQAAEHGQAYEKQMQQMLQKIYAPASSVDVLIVGAGPTGLTLACEAARRGLSHRIVEKLTEPLPWSRALGVQARTLEVFAQMGIAEEAVARGHKAHGASIYGDGQRLVHLTLDELDSPYPFILILPQSETERLLTERLAALGGRIERGVELAGFTADNDGVAATLRQAAGRVETVRARWLVGADGAHSMVRHGLGLPFEGAAYPETFLLADGRMAGPLASDEISLYLRTDGILGIFPLGDGVFRMLGDLPPDTDPASEPTLAECQAILDARGPGGVTLSDPRWLSRFRIHRRLVSQIRQGRVFLAGDASHIHSPAGGQGMNTGIQDAFNLAWKLALVAQGVSSDTLLDSYQAERHGVAKAVLRGTDFLMRVVSLHNPMATALRDRLLPLLAAQEVIQQRLRRTISELELSYRHSPIVEDHGGSGGPQAGDRAPEALTDTRHTLRLPAGPSPSPDDRDRLTDIGQRVGADYGTFVEVLPITTDGDTNARYGVKHPCLYLIRPDGYIGFRVGLGDAERLFSYLKRLFP